MQHADEKTIIEVKDMMLELMLKRIIAFGDDEASVLKDKHAKDGHNVDTKDENANCQCG